MWKIILPHISTDGELSLIKNTRIYKLEVSDRKDNAKYIPLQNTIGNKLKEETNGTLVQNRSTLGVTITLLIWKIAQWPYLASLQETAETQYSWLLFRPINKESYFLWSHLYTTFRYVFVHVHIKHRHPIVSFEYDNILQPYKVIQKVYINFQNNKIKI